MSLLNRTFQTGDLVRAANISNAILQTWIRRGFIIGSDKSPIEMPGSPGHRRQFTFENVIEVAIAAALAALGVELVHAFAAAAHFAHTGAAERPPAFPFNSDGRTFIAVAGDRSQVFSSTTFGLGANQWRGLGSPDAFVVVVASEIFDRVVAQLGEHPQRLIEQAYAERGAND